jgi:hypothetical protein
MFGAERILFYLNFIAELVLLWRLVHYRLYQSYRSLFLYWLVQALTTLVILPVPMRTYLYLYMYWAAQSIYLLMAVFVVQDLYRMALQEHPSVAAFGRQSVMAAMVLAAVVALSGIKLDSTILPGHYPAIQRFLTFERTLDFVLLIFLLLISGFLLWFPIKVRRNIIVYISGFVLYHASRSFGVLLINLRPQASTAVISTVLLGFSLLCLLIWIVEIRPEGERVTTTLGYRSDPEVMQRHSRQLDAINSALARIGRS